MRILKYTYYYYNFQKNFFPFFKEKLKKRSIEKVISISIPYLALYEPLGRALAAAAGTLQVYSLLKDSKTSCIWRAYRIAAASCSILGTLNKNPWVAVLTNADEMGNEMCHLAKQLYQKEWAGAMDSSLQIANHALYLATLFSRSKEMMVLSYTAQAVSSLWQAFKEFHQGNRAEGCGHLGISAIRAYQAKPYLEQCLRKRMLLRKYSHFRERIQLGKELTPKEGNPMKNLDGFFEQHDIFYDDPVFGRIDLGAHISNLGGIALRRGQAIIRKKDIEGKKVTEIEFRLTKLFRDYIQPSLDGLESIPFEEFSEFLAVSGISHSGFEMQRIPYTFLKREGETFTAKNQTEFGEAYLLNLHGIGSVTVGATPKQRGMYRRLVIQVEEGQEFQGAATLLSLLNLTNIIRASSKEEIEILKLMTLFRMHFPKEATQCDQRELSLFSYSEIKEEISRIAPQMKEIIETDLPRMYPYEPIRGKVLWALSGRDIQAQDLGVRALITAVGRKKDAQAAANELASMCQTGMLSAEQRFGAGLTIQGASPKTDVEKGSNDKCYVRAAPPKGLDPYQVDSFLFSGHYVILIPPSEILNTHTRQYPGDEYGASFGEVYENRNSLLSFVSQLYAHKGYRRLNELGVSDRIPPEKLKRIIILPKDEENKQILETTLRKRGLIYSQDGKEWFQGRRLEKAIRLEKEITDSLLDEVQAKDTFYT